MRFRVRELIKRLRRLDDEVMCFDGPETYSLIAEAADTLESQAQEIARLRMGVNAQKPPTQPGERTEISRTQEQIL